MVRREGWGGFSFLRFYFIFFLCGPFLKSLLNLLSCCSMFWLFGCEACEILAPRPGIEPTSPALDGKVLTIGLLGVSQDGGLNQAHC